MPHAQLWTKILHVVFVIAWMASVFYLPRLLVNLAETRDQSEVQQRLLLMCRRLYRFGHIMFGIAVILGTVLWLQFGIGGGWLHVKLVLVLLLLAYYIGCGWLFKRLAQAGRALPSSRTLRWINELPVFVLVAIVWLVLAKPF